MMTGDLESQLELANASHGVVKNVEIVPPHTKTTQSSLSSRSMILSHLFQKKKPPCPWVEEKAEKSSEQYGDEQHNALHHGQGKSYFLGFFFGPPRCCMRCFILSCIRIDCSACLISW